jgi:hypothetical protein
MMGESGPKGLVRPVAAMTDVLKKLLKNIAKNVRRSNKTVLKVNTKAAKAEKRLKWVSFLSDSEPGLAYSPNVKPSVLPANIREALAINLSQLEIDLHTRANLVCATIPEMLAWLHVKASYLKGVEMEGTEFRRGFVKGVVRWKNGPAMEDHEGRDPCIVVLHHDTGIRLLYWFYPVSYSSTRGVLVHKNHGV